MPLDALRDDAATKARDIRASHPDLNLSPDLADTLPVVLAASPFVAQALRRDAGLLDDLATSGDLLQGYAEQGMAERLRARLAGIEDERVLGRVLRHFRRREMVRIAWRDLIGQAETAETLRDLSDLADVCVGLTLDWHEARLVARHGVPRDDAGARQGLVVLGMGKLGGRELNYSSDIDLIFTFESEGETDGDKALSNSQFFIRLGQRLIRSLNDVTEDGFVFRVDMRLRPYGDEGPLAMSFDGMELYYATQGREWERYALIKARVIAGDRPAGQRLMEMLRPFVFRRYLDYGAFAQLRDMKQMIEREMARKGMRDNLKLGPGGIREIEFIGQLFQLIRGGREPALQARGILAVLDSLVGLGELPRAVVDDLTAGYDFLRRSENRLQMMHDQQTQTLPVDEEDRQRLALAMGFDAGWESYMAALDEHRQRVHRHFGDVMRVPGDTDDEPAAQDPLEQVWKDDLDREAAEAALAAAGFREPASALTVLSTWRSELSGHESGAARSRLDALMPGLLRAVGASSAPEGALPRVLNLISRVVRRSVYIALLVEQPQALHQLVRLCAASPWIAELLAQHPILLDELIDPHALYEPPDRQTLADELARVIQNCDGDPEREMDELRRFRQLAVLRVAAADVADALPVMKVSDHLTWIAEVILEQVLELAWAQLVARHGCPGGQRDGQPLWPGFAIIGYGKLGGIELGYGSDLDLVFLHDSEGEDTVTDGEKSIDNSLFFARLAQKVIHLLNTRSQAGILYEVDTRLRPDGASGLLVSSMRAFEDYQRHHAWTWEIQALARARFIAGNPAIAERFDAIRHEMLCREREPEALRKEVADMRRKMREEHRAPSGLFHLKKGPGGITDIEFIVQYLLLAHAHRHPELPAHTDNIRQLEALAQAAVLTAEQASALIDAYRALRDGGHAQVLKGEKALVPDDRFRAQREQVIERWQAVFGEPPA